MAKTRTRAPLKLQHEAFVRAYLSHNGNATQAYQACYPKASRTTCATEGWKLLRIPKIAAKVREEWHKQLAKQKLDADAVIGMIGNEAQADVRQLFDRKGKMLPPHEWPTHLATCVEGIKLNDDGSATVKLASQSQARWRLLELLGRTRSVADSIDHMADAIRFDRAKHLKE
jgi:phage terminase small subunit